jgi:hypothetical protein
MNTSLALFSFLCKDCSRGTYIVGCGNGPPGDAGIFTAPRESGPNLLGFK